MRPFAAALAAALLACGCATHQLRFQPWKGLPSEALPQLQRGVYDVPKEKLMDAAAVTLEHEPYFHWTFDSLDKANGLIIGSAGLFREVQLRVTDEDGGKSRLAVSVPRRVLKTQAKIYVLRSDPDHKTAYEPEEAQRDQYNVIAADAELDEDYFYSFTYRAMNDRSQVPFTLKAYEDDGALGEAPQQVSTPEPLPATASAPQALSPSATAAPAAVSPAATALPPAHRE
jgi:hypothetical protein